MAEPFLGEIRAFGFNFAPRGWAACDGQILPINQNQSLYSLLGTTFGGDGRTSFALPDLRGRAPVHPGANSVSQGTRAGEETVTLSVGQMPQHRHALNVSQSPGNRPVVDSSVLANGGSDTYAGATNLVAMAAGAIVNTGGGQAHDNMQPFLTLNFCIALQGLFPSRN